jgi:valyl-tRNA synthetase
VLLQDTTPHDTRLLAVHDGYLRELARLADIQVLGAGSQAPPSATALVGAMKLLVPIAGLIDVAAERSRLAKNRQKAATDLERVEQKLATGTFVSNAPASVVAKERERQQALRRDLEKLDAQLAQLAGL